MRSVGYHGKSRVLEIEFDSGAVYQYVGVPARIYPQLLRAESKGRYFNSEIRDVYPSVPVKRTKAAGWRALREIVGGLAASEGKLQHLGVAVAPKRSTRAYANEHRPWQLFQSVFEALYQRCLADAGQRGRRKFRFKHKLLSLDATLIPLCLSMFDWAQYRRSKGAVKLRRVSAPTGRCCSSLQMERPIILARSKRTVQTVPWSSPIPSSTFSLFLRTVAG
jgi:hypothetical protein